MRARPLYLPCLLLLGAPGAAAAQQAVYPDAFVPTPVEVDDLAVGDIDADGDLDLVTLQWEKNAYVTLPALGLGQFGNGSVNLVDNLGELLDVALADLDGDGAADLLLGSDTGVGPTDAVLVFAAAGDGNFGLPVPVPVASGPGDLAPADLDLDGDLDVAVACRDGGRISLLAGDGDGHLVPVPDVGAGGEPWAVDVGDLDTDGHPELVVALHDQAVLGIVMASGVGWQPIITVPAAVEPSDVALGDVDADGRLDALAGTDEGSECALVRGVGHGHFAPPTLWPTGPVPATVALADLDEDGDDDGIAGLEKEIAIAVLESTGEAAFQPPQDWAAFAAGRGPVVADLNGDGDPDVASTAPSGQFGGYPGVFLMIGDGDGRFGPLTVAVDGFSYTLASGDLDEDGVPDLVLASSYQPGSEVQVALAGLEGTLSAFTGHEDGSDSRVLDTCDFDGDGHVDVASSDHDGFVRVHFGDGTGDLPDVLVFPTGISFVDMLAGEVDGRPGIDLVGADGFYGRLLLLRNDGAGGIGRMDVITTSPYLPLGLALADVQGDGELDIASAGQIGFAGHFGVDASLGGGQFASPEVVPLSFVPTAVALGDLDADGDADAVLPLGLTERLAVLLNSGGSFTSLPDVVVPGTYPLDVAISDVDGDGVLDALLANWHFYHDSTAWVLLGDGLGGFGAPSVVATPNDLQQVRPVDVDLDGAPDLALATLGGEAGVLRNALGPWHTLGHPLAGSQGLAELTGVGTLADGSPVELHLDEARRDAAALLVAGAAPALLPFSGGVLVPTVDLVLGPVPLDEHGDVSIAGSWPVGLPAGTPVFLQAWWPDRAGAQGWAASNGLRAAAWLVPGQSP